MKYRHLSLISNGNFVEQLVYTYIGQIKIHYKRPKIRGEKTSRLRTNTPGIFLNFLNFESSIGAKGIQEGKRERWRGCLSRIQTERKRNDNIYIYIYIYLMFFLVVLVLFSGKFSCKLETPHKP